MEMQYVAFAADLLGLSHVPARPLISINVAPHKTRH